MPTTERIEESAAWEMLKGAVDVHVHAGLSLFPRLYDDWELAKQAAKAGLAAVVLKAHEGSSVERAHVADRYVAGIQVFGGVVLNHFVGGFNPYSVELALGLGGKIVWMPTIHAQNHLRYYGDAGYQEMAATIQLKYPVKPLRILDDSGRLLPEVIDIVKIVAERDAVLATGHLSLEEIGQLVPAARELGVKRVVLNHPELPVSSLPLDFQLEMARLGVYIERSFLPTTEKWGRYPISRTAEEIRRIGPERCLLETDLGEKDGLDPSEGLMRFCCGLFEAGIPWHWIRQMVAENPRQLLGMS